MVEQELMEVLVEAAVVVETMPAVPEIPLPLAPLRDMTAVNQNHNLPPVMTGEAVVVVHPLLEQMLLMTPVRQVPVVQVALLQCLARM